MNEYTEKRFQIPFSSPWYRGMTVFYKRRKDQRHWNVVCTTNYDGKKTFITFDKPTQKLAEHFYTLECENGRGKFK